MHDYDVQTTLKDLGKAFHEFKATQDEKFKHLEKTDHAPADLEEKLDRLEHAMDGAERKLQSLQAAQLRPEKPNPTLEAHHDAHHGFTEFIRKGTLAPLEGKALSTNPDTEGGYVVPDGIDYNLRQILQQQSVLRGLASVRQISTGSLELLIDKEMADAGWVAEKDDRPETETPDLDHLQIHTHEMYAKPKATQRFLDDAKMNVENWICQKISQKMAAMENEAFLFGDGNGRPRGILSHPTAEGNAAWGELEEIKTGENGRFAQGQAVETLIETYHSLKPQYMQGACWLMPRSAQARIRRLKDRTTGIYLWQPSLAEGTCSTLLGHPIHLCDTLPPLEAETESKSIIFGNFKEGYQILERQGTRVLRDPYSSKPFVEFYVTRRVGGDVVNFEALKVINFSA